MVCMDSIYRTLLAFSSIHVRHDEAFGERNEVILLSRYSDRLPFGVAYFLVDMWSKIFDGEMGEWVNVYVALGMGKAIYPIKLI